MGKLKETLKNLAKEYQTEIQRLIVQEKLVDKGDLKNSIKYKVTEDGFSIESDEKHAYILGSNGYLKDGSDLTLEIYLSGLKERVLDREVRRVGLER